MADFCYFCKKKIGFFDTSSRTAFAQTVCGNCVNKVNRVAILYNREFSEYTLYSLEDAGKILEKAPSFEMYISRYLKIRAEYEPQIQHYQELAEKEKKTLKEIEKGMDDDRREYEAELKECEKEWKAERASSDYKNELKEYEKARRRGDEVAARTLKRLMDAVDDNYRAEVEKKQNSYRAQAETASQGSKTTSGKGCARTGCGCLTVFIVIFMFMGVVGSFSLTKENKSASASEVSTAASMNDQSESRTEETMPISNETKASSEIQNGPIYNSVDPPDSTDSRQEILVEATGSNAMLTLWTYRDGQWVEDMSTTAAIGSDGLTTNKTEGDHMTPEGTFPIYFAFSTKAKNTKIAFETISEDSVWVCDPESVYYNTLQSKNNPDKDWTDKGGAENMYPKFSKGSSNACICFGFNGDGWSPYGAVAYGGSALFIDGVGENGKMNSGYGDIKISGKDMTKLLSYLDSDYNPTITIRAAQ